MDTLREWIASTTGGDSRRKIAGQIEMAPATLDYQLNGVTPAATVVAIARAYGASPLSGLVALGLITDEEAEAGDLESALRRITDKALTDEILRRIEEGGVGEHPRLTEPLEPGPRRPIPFPASEMSDLDGSVYDEKNVMAASEKNYDDEVEGRLNE